MDAQINLGSNNPLHCGGAGGQKKKEDAKMDASAQVGLDHLAKGLPREFSMSCASTASPAIVEGPKSNNNLGCQDAGVLAVHVCCPAALTDCLLLTRVVHIQLERSSRWSRARQLANKTYPYGAVCVCVCV